jgi:dTDP-4-amino-4,6-dideoxygalactose transaminase
LADRAVPMVDLKAQYARIKTDVDAAIARIIEQTAFVRGKDCTLFEEEFARYCGVAHAVGVANGTDALTIALWASNVGPGDEVATTTSTFIATGEAILLNRAKPVFVDIDPDTFTMDPGHLKRVITPRTKVILPVHLYGLPADMTAILDVAAKKGIPVLEDAAQAHGALVGEKKAGSLGRAGCFSFYPGKNLGAYGDAGMVVTDDYDFSVRVRRIANHGGGVDKYDNVVPGTNSRLDTLQAAVLRAKLPHLDLWTRERRERAQAYTRALEGVKSVLTPKEPAGRQSAWHLYTIRVRDREGLQDHLKEKGISTAIHYPKPLHLQPAMSAAGGRTGDCPVAERLSLEVLSLPLYPELPMEELERIAGEVRAFCR